jgi:transketolase
LVYAQLGISHQCCEDIAALRALQGMTIYSAADRHEMNVCALLALEGEGPAYLRIGKCDLGELHSGPITLAPGGLLELRPGTGDVAWLATGSMVRSALAVARRWPRSAVWSVPCLKPVDEEQVRAICRRHKVVVTIEEHALEGGLGSLICEIAAETAEARICRIGVANPFFNRCGSYEYLIRQQGLSLEGIAAKVTKFMDAGPASFRRRAA